MQWLEKVVYYLDDAFEIPIIKKRIGIDPIIGMVPILGDILGYVFSLVPLVYAIKEGVSIRVLIRMILNSLMDTTLGSVPVLGDLFDFVFQSNRKNYNLLKEYRENPIAIKNRTTLQFVLIGSFILLVFVSICVGIWLLLQTIFDSVSTLF